MINSRSALWSTVVLTAVAVVYLSKVVLASPGEGEDHQGIGTCDSTYIVQEGELLLYHFASTSSTQDEAKTILSTTEIPNDVRTVVVTAAEQTTGRGTNGRSWFGSRGNTFVTICVRQKGWLQTKLPMTLLPVKVGTVMAERIDELLQSCRQTQGTTTKTTTQPHQPNDLPAITTIKWPNDVLVDEQKISGVLIESDRDWFVIGIGVNVAHSPTVPSSGPNSGRTATSIRNYCPIQYEQHSDEYVIMAKELGQNMARDLSDWLTVHENDGATQADEEQTAMLRLWRGWVDWDMVLMLRDGDNKELVVPLDIIPDGRLKVRDSGGRERLVVTDYFY